MTTDKQELQNRLTELEHENFRLNQQMEFYKQFMHNSNYWETYRDKTGKLVYISPNLEEKLGNRKDAYINGLIQITDFIHEDDIDKILSNYKKVMQGSDVAPHKCRLNSKLSLEYVLIDYKRVLDDNGEFNGIRTCISDITELEKKERNIHNTDELLRNITDNIPALVGQIDTDLKYTYVNKRYADYSGIEVDKIIGSDVVDIISKDTFEISHRHMLRALSGEFVSFETRYKNSAGEVSIFKSNFVPDIKNNQVIGFMVLAWDITKEQQAEIALKESEDRFRGLFKQSHAAMAMVGLDMRFIECNEAFCTLIGYNESELIEKTVADITHPEDRKIGMTEIKSIARGEIQYALVQKRYLNKNKTVIRGELTISIVRNEDGKPWYYIVLIQDVTKRYMAEKALKETDIQLKELNDTKDKLFSIIAHDLRSPFSNIVSLSDLLNDNEIELDSTQSNKFIELINSAAKSSLTLLDNLLNWSKSQTGKLENKPEEIVMSRLLNKVKENLKAQAVVKDISLNILQSEEAVICADENMVRLIFRNLISNAIKFTNPGGRIDLIAIKKLNAVEISVRDNGVGIPEDKLNQLFTINSETQSVGTANEKGSGLGLILCKEFVEKLGGKIWVESQTGEGSRFTFTLPLS